MIVPAELTEAVRLRKAVLFVGAGVSMELGLPSFAQVIDIMAAELGYDPDIFRSLGPPQVLAEYYKLRRSTIGPLRSRLDTKWHAGDVRIENSIVHQVIVELGFPLIYTTNYDRWLEKAHEYWKRPFTKIANVADIGTEQAEATQIVKFHGDFDDDSSIVLTESSYFDRLDFTSPLDIKLRADTLGRSILFVGYSLDDINIRLLLYKLHRLWAASLYASARPKSYILLRHPNAVVEAVLKERGVVPVVANSGDASGGVREFLQALLKSAFNRVIPDEEAR